MKQSAHKTYTDTLEYETKMLNNHRELLKNAGNEITETKFKKIYFEQFGTVSLSTYNKYLRELKNGTYIRCEREEPVSNQSTFKKLGKQQ